MPPERAVPPAASVRLSSPASFVRQTLAVAEADVRKLRHDPTELLTRAVQPTLWLLVFGQVMGRLRGVPTGGMPYQDFLAPGILAQSVLFIAIFYGISIIWERDMGILQKFLASPTPRVALVLGKALSAGVRGLTQVVFIYLLALLIGINVRFSFFSILGVLLCTLLGAAIFSTLSMIVACLVKTRERMMGIGQVLTMPLFFASNAIYPLALMPAWLQVIAKINPLSYQVDLLRALMIQGGRSSFGIGVDFAVQFGVLIVLVGLAARLFSRVVA